MKQNKKPLSGNGFIQPKKHLMNYGRIRRFVVLLTAGVSLIPLIFITVVDYKVTQHSIEAESVARTTRIISNTQRAISFFLAERKSALNFIIYDNNYQELDNPQRLTSILKNHQKSFGTGFMDIGIIDSAGYQQSYVGPYNLKGKNYSNQDWYKKVVKHGAHISNVFLGYRKVPHFVIAVKSTMANGSFFILRASIGIKPFEDLISNLELEGLGDAFMIDHEGALQTSSRYYGNILDIFPMPVPLFSETSRVYESEHKHGEKLVIGYRFIDNSPFILMIVKNKRELMKPWFETRLKLIAFLFGSITVILSVILWTSGYMIQRIKVADNKRLMSLHQVEHANKMASIGRLATNVAHEINNPLAIINEKAGLIKDLFVIKKEYSNDQKLIGIVDAILSSVKRAGTITKRLLTFARNFELSIQKISISELLVEILSFFQKEADSRKIVVKLNIDPNMPEIESDQGKLQQIFVNIINNAFAAVDDGGHIEINTGTENDHQIYILFSDDGCGIQQDDIHRIFEPFFSTKTNRGGTGLGLSITYNLVQEIRGIVSVESKTGKGTTFKVILPLKME
jgi:signal transduction histidine kinase